LRGGGRHFRKAEVKREEGSNAGEKREVRLRPMCVVGVLEEVVSRRGFEGEEEGERRVCRVGKIGRSRRLSRGNKGRRNEVMR